MDSVTPIVALTANVMKDDVEKYYANGFTGHLGKPLDIQELYKTLYKTMAS